jgi:predicted permease
MLSDFLHRLRALFRRNSIEAELDAELRAHIELQAEKYVQAGMSPEEAARRARLEFGGVEQIKEDVRDSWGVRVINELAQDVRYGLRQLRRNPGFTVVAALTLALGVGVNSGIFTVLNAWLFRPLPVRAPEQLVVLAFRPKGASRSGFSYSDFLDFQKQAGAFSDVLAYGTGAAGLTAGGEVSEFAYSAVSGNYFKALGLKPLLGRLLLPGEGDRPGEGLLVVLGYSFWQRRLGGDASIVGKQVLVDGKPATVVGVTPKGFQGTLFAFDMDGYLSLNSIPMFEGSSVFWTDRNDRELTVLGRLKSGATRTEAQSSADLVAKRLASQYPETDTGAAVRVIPERLARPAPIVASFVPAIAGLFLAMPLLVLLLACLNVGNVMMARALGRQREMAIRAAVGADRWRLVRQMLTEGLLLALLGGAAGAVLGRWAVGASGSMVRSVSTTTSNMAFRLNYGFDWRVFGYTLGAALLSGIVVGVWPAFRLSRLNLNAVLHQGEQSGFWGMGRRRAVNFLVATQVAGSVILLVAAGLFVRSLWRAEHMDLGFDPNHVLNVMLDARQAGYTDIRAKAFYRELEDHIRGLPGARSVSLAAAVPLGTPSPTGSVYIEGRPLAPGERPPEISYDSVDPAYFKTMRIPLLRGRGFANSDTQTTTAVAIVNQTMARKLWPNDDPLGKRFSLKSPSGPFMEVVGVARDGQNMWYLSPEPQAYFYLPLAQRFSPSLSMQVRCVVPPESLFHTVEREVRKLSPNLPIIDARTMEQEIHGLAGLFIFRLAAALAAVMGSLGLVLAVVGMYGLVSFGVSRRRHEFGIRMALGAQRRDILRLTLGQGLAPVVVGVAAGLVLAWVFARAVAKLLMGVKPTDPLTFIAVSLILIIVALLACYIPARRAAKVDPMVALRYE